MIREVLTNPKEHNKDDFIYLVHGLLDRNGNGISPQELKEKVQWVNDPSQFYRASLIGHLDERVAKERFGYRRDINQSGTFGDIGLILDPTNEDSLYIAWNCDLGSPGDPEQLREYALKNRGKRKYPFELLTQTVGPKGREYNELILKGDKDTAVKGVFFRGDDANTKDKARMLTDITCEAVQSEVPVVELPQYPRPSYEEIEDPEQRKLAQSFDMLGSQNQIMQAHLEFEDPNHYRDRFEIRAISPWR
ncbi:MAG: hypothetical protein U9Q06_03835 [Nanoarchaeota archaeon]|nr:hypothetical protein [Nanoarchaeota archaeon]